jgi:hypothetical protein
VDSGGCGRNPASCPPTCTPASGVTACSPPSVRSSLRAGLVFDARGERWCARARSFGQRAYAPVPGHFWWAR